MTARMIIQLCKQDMNNLKASSNCRTACRTVTLSSACLARKWTGSRINWRKIHAQLSIHFISSMEGCRNRQNRSVKKRKNPPSRTSLTYDSGTVMVLTCWGETAKTICPERPKRMTILRLEDGYTESGTDSPGPYAYVVDEPVKFFL